MEASYHLSFAKPQILAVSSEFTTKSQEIKVVLLITDLRNSTFIKENLGSSLSSLSNLQLSWPSRAIYLSDF